MYQEHENVSTRLQRLMTAQQQLDTQIVHTVKAARARSPSPLLYPRPHSPKLSRAERSEIGEEKYESRLPVVETEAVDDEWMRRMHANRMGLDEPIDDPPVLVERVLVSSSSLRSRSPSPVVRMVSSPGRLVSPVRHHSPTHFHSFGRAVHQPDVTEELQRKLSPHMRERIRSALNKSLLDTSEEELEQYSVLSPTTKESLGRAYQMATSDRGTNQGEPSHSHRVLYDVIYGLEDRTGVDDSAIEFAEFRGWLDRIFDQTKPAAANPAINKEMIDRVRTAWRAQDTRVGAHTVNQLKLALKQAEKDGQDGKRYLFQLVDTDGHGTKPEFEAWCLEIFGAYPSPPRVSTSPESPAKQHWDELQSPVFDRVGNRPAPVVTARASAGPSPWGAVSYTHLTLPTKRIV
eukprot:TRINITY_DN11911_c0_g1_i2.p1 TRINITY_DN11911_c0_g1~~TRINITY_DN11911_c0_g1_i2.p1  ORF type:complete len:404 (-),score=82.12 TRINITY_DN11911_c0_g1_i2:89-1300(-)